MKVWCARPVVDGPKWSLNHRRYIKIGKNGRFWYLTLNPNIIVIQLLFSTMMMTIFCCIYCFSKSSKKNVEVYFLRFICIIHCWARWVDLWNCVYHTHKPEVFVRWLYNELRRMQHILTKINNEYNGRRWKCTPLSWILTMYSYCLSWNT